MMTALLLVLSFLLVPGHLVAQTVPGCVNGSLQDPHALFTSLVAGTSATDYTSVLPRLRAPLAQYGIDVQHASDGTVRPRLYLPTGQQPFGADFGHAVDVTDNPPQTPWRWKDYGGGFVPYPCVSAPAPNPTPAPTPVPQPTPVPPPIVQTVDLSPALNAIAALSSKVDTLTQKLDAHAAAEEEHWAHVKSAWQSVLEPITKYILPPLGAAIAGWKLGS